MIFGRIGGGNAGRYEKARADSRSNGFFKPVFLVFFSLPYVDGFHIAGAGALQFCTSGADGGGHDSQGCVLFVIQTARRTCVAGDSRAMLSWPC